jgi:hypothetical protein
MASAINYDALPSMTLIDQISTLTEHISPAEQMELAMDLLNGLKAVLGGAKGVAKAKTAKAKATAEPKEPKALTGGQQTWRDGLTYVWNTVKETDPKFSYKNAMKFASTLKTHADWPAPPATAVKEAYTTWLAENPPSETTSVASASSKSSGSSKKIADMTEDEKKAYYKARAAKAAATRAAKKAAAGGSAEAEAEEDYSGDEAKEWVHKGKTYLRAKNYLWDAETNEYVGGWNEAKKTIDKKVPAPEME